MKFFVFRSIKFTHEKKQGRDEMIELFGRAENKNVSITNSPIILSLSLSFLYTYVYLSFSFRFLSLTLSHSRLISHSPFPQTSFFFFFMPPSFPSLLLFIFPFILFFIRFYKHTFTHF